jgi:hypothetical protein
MEKAAGSCWRLLICEVPLKEGNGIGVEVEVVKQTENITTASSIVIATFWFKQHPANVRYSAIYHIL